MNAPCPLQSPDLEWALDYLSPDPGRSRATRDNHLHAFQQYLTTCQVRWLGWYCGSSESVQALFFALLIPGRTAMILRPANSRSESDLAERLLRFGLDELGKRKLHYAQVLVEPDTAHERQLLESIGFRPLARLLYMERQIVGPAPPHVPQLGEWLVFNEEVRAEFERLLQATDEESLDCPALTGIRPPGDVLRSHQAAGEFDPRYWQILRIGGVSAGCILVSRMPWAATMEIVYVGVAREFRRRGVGSALLQRALDHGRTARVERMMVVVDEQNTPARRLYQRFGFVGVAQRDALLFRWPPS